MATKNERDCSCSKCDFAKCACKAEAKGGCACAPSCGCDEPCRCDGCAAVVDQDGTEANDISLAALKVLFAK